MVSLSTPNHVTVTNLLHIALGYCLTLFPDILRACRESFILT